MRYGNEKQKQKQKQKQKTLIFTCSKTKTGGGREAYIPPDMRRRIFEPAYPAAGLWNTADSRLPTFCSPRNSGLTP